MGCDQSSLPGEEKCEDYKMVNNKFLDIDGLNNFVDFAEPVPDKVLKKNRMR